MSNEVEKQEVASDSSAEETPKKRPTSKVSNKSVELGIFRLGDDIELPKYQTEQSACFDLSSYIIEGKSIKCINQGNEKIEREVQLVDGVPSVPLHPRERMLVPTGLVLDIPDGYCIEVYPRSGTSFKNGLGLSNSVGMIDSDYTEELFISIINNSNISHFIKSGERIAQAKLVELVPTTIKDIKGKPSNKTSRKGGFGSTGK